MGMRCLIIRSIVCFGFDYGMRNYPVADLSAELAGQQLLGNGKGGLIEK